MENGGQYQDNRIASSDIFRKQFRKFYMTILEGNIPL